MYCTCIIEIEWSETLRSICYTAINYTLIIHVPTFVSVRSLLPTSRPVLAPQVCECIKLTNLYTFYAELLFVAFLFYFLN